MPRKGKGPSKQNEEDDLEFLTQMAEANQQKKAEIIDVKENETVKETIILAEGLPEAPSVAFPNNTYPENEWLDYKDSLLWRKTDHDKIEVERIEYLTSIMPDLREGAEIHRRVRLWAQEQLIKPGVLLFDMCSQIEEAVRRLSFYEPKVRGLAFPCGCSLNNCAAHYTPLRNDNRF